jgi:hypoxanthine phosphoribosyltransferase
MATVELHKQYVDEQTLIEDSFRLGREVFKSGFQPDFLVGLWRGGSTIGIYVQECLQYLGVETDHISVRTSYRGLEHYAREIAAGDIRVHGLQYLLENMNHENSTLIVDDVFSTGNSIEALLNTLERKTKRNLPRDIRIATPYYKPGQNQTGRIPDYYIHTTDDWLVLPYELTGLSRQELIANKPWAAEILKVK